MYQESEVNMDKVINELTETINSNDLILVAGRPLTGKATFSLKLASEMTKKNNKNVVYFSFEESPKTLYSRIKEKINNSSPNDNIYVINGIDTKSMIDIKKILAEFKDVGAVIIDYLQLLEIRYNKQEYNEVLEELKLIVVEFNVPIIVVHQLGIKFDKIKPTLEDLQNSSIDVDIINKVIFSYPDKSFHIGK